MTTARRPLSREQIVEAALALLDREGLTALTMRRLGRELGVEGMAIYSHFRNKAELLFALVKRFIDEIHPEYEPGADWQMRLRAAMRSFRRVGLAHPSVFSLLTTRPWDGVALRRLDEDLSWLHEAGFSPEASAYALSTLLSFVTGFVTREIRSTLRQPFAVAESDASFISEQVRASYPYLAAARRYMYGPDASHETAFETGLDVIFAGLNALRSGKIVAPGKHVDVEPRWPDTSEPRAVAGESAT
jgi:AcrR family transcriptional regulator